MGERSFKLSAVGAADFFPDYSSNKKRPPYQEASLLLIHPVPISYGAGTATRFPGTTCGW